MKAFSYILFSTPQQAEGGSLRRQLDLSDKYAAKHNLEINDSVRITDFGKSAYTGQHHSEGSLLDNRQKPHCPSGLGRKRAGGGVAARLQPAAGMPRSLRLAESPF
ncbi:MAG: hypothetical protein Fur0032_11520 [Terrimicrobiaceae bacterium]